LKSYLTPLLLLLFISCRKEKETTIPKAGNPFYDKAFEYQEQEKSDSAFLYFNKAKDVFLQRSDSLNAGACLVYMAIISTNKGDSFDGQEISLDALSYFNKNKKEHAAYIKSTLNNLGITSFNLKNYTQAIDFYNQSLNFTPDSASILVIQNNIANAYREKKEYKKSLQIYSNILDQRVKNQVEFARTLTNISFTKWLQNPNYIASAELLKALHIREQEKDLWGLNSSYAHLTDYYLKRKPDSALYFAQKMYQVARTLNSVDDRLEALQKLIKLSPATASKQYFETYQSLNDSILTVRNAAKNQFALIRYEMEKNKATNLALQKDNAAKQYQIIIIACAALATITIGFIWYKKRKQKLESEARNAIKESQLKTSKKVHDVVANGLYRVMSEIQNQDEVDKDGVLDKIEDLYEKSRDISYDEIVYHDQDFHLKLLELLSSFATDQTKILLVGNTTALWKNINAQIKYELEHILQELLVNMKKHSQATNVVIKFEQVNQHITIYYTDNGIGISKNTSFNNGLSNTGNRIKTIHGAITFDTQTEKGLKIQITFPVA